MYEGNELHPPRTNLSRRVVMLPQLPGLPDAQARMRGLRAAPRFWLQLRLDCFGDRKQWSKGMADQVGVARPNPDVCCLGVIFDPEALGVEVLKERTETLVQFGLQVQV